MAYQYNLAAGHIEIPLCFEVRKGPRCPRSAHRRLSPSNKRISIARCLSLIQGWEKQAVAEPGMTRARYSAEAADQSRARGGLRFLAAQGPEISRGGAGAARNHGTVKPEKEALIGRCGIFSCFYSYFTLHST